MHPELVLDSEALEETGQLLKVNLLHSRLVPVVWERIITVSGAVSTRLFDHLGQTYASDDLSRSSIVGGT